ncbi:hypothetical protein OTBS_1564 [Orientia tsutsugamushi str. Boryong]|uniref:Uncharacterized protein n=1 Tax=Orientia tsutsugamushi (strain Boryong) TaxID=357244 RepID=A5CEN2_ORITB|nr:hypothetical protein OTBS_1564 [Orientia tsutsugamushi str. Boryong]
MLDNDLNNLASILIFFAAHFFIHGFINSHILISGFRSLLIPSTTIIVFCNSNNCG